MNHNWGYVIAGYSITTVVFVSYAVWIRQKTRQLRRSLPDENRD